MTDAQRARVTALEAEIVSLTDAIAAKSAHVLTISNRIMRHRADAELQTTRARLLALTNELADIRINFFF
jgi:hypothetical protein